MHGKSEKKSEAKGQPLRQPPGREKAPLRCPGGKRPGVPKTAAGCSQNIQVCGKALYGFAGEIML